MAQEFGRACGTCLPRRSVLNEVPEHMAQELARSGQHDAVVESSMKFLSTWLRNHSLCLLCVRDTIVLNEVPEHMAQESPVKEWLADHKISPQ